MRTHVVASSNIVSVDYHEDKQYLDVQFKNGGKYRYFDVPEDIVNTMVTAKSVGKFFHQNVRNTYAYERLNT